MKDKNFLEKYNRTWKKVSNINKKEFDSKSVYYKEYLTTKIKSYHGKNQYKFSQ